MAGFLPRGHLMNLVFLGREPVGGATDGRIERESVWRSISRSGSI